MVEQTATSRSSWVWLLELFTFGSFIETVFYGQMSAFTPLYLPQIEVRKVEPVYKTFAEKVS